ASPPLPSPPLPHAAAAPPHRPTHRCSSCSPAMPTRAAATPPWPRSTRQRPASRSRSSTFPTMTWRPRSATPPRPMTSRRAAAPYEALEPKVRNASKANDLPAIGRVPSIAPVWLDRTVDLADIAAEVKPIEGMYAADEDGKVPALPSDLTAVGMFLNKDLWDEAGVEYPTSFDDNVWTWDEFLEAANEVREATGIRFSLTMDRSSHRLDSFLYQNGSEGLRLSEDLSQYEANDATVGALERFIAMNDDEVMPRSVWLTEEDPNAMFK